MKKISLKHVLTAAIVAASVLWAAPVFAATTLYQQITNDVLSKGINYTIKHTLTDEGWLDIYVLETDMSNPNINIAPVDSKKDVGLRETVDRLLSENNAVAGVNSGYFGMTSSYSASFGPEIVKGDVVSLDTDKNLDSNQFGTFFIDKNSNPLFGYFKTNMEFYAAGTKVFDYSGINKITQMIYPVYIDKNAFNDTSSLDARFPGLYKVVVENNVITYISWAGETVKVPDNGYLIVFNGTNATDYLSPLAVGQSAETKVTSSFDLNSIETAISGGGIFMQNGMKNADTGEMATGRQPRTLLGLSADKKTLKLIVVDGQRTGGTNVSIGANIDECVGILQNEGCAYAMNLDGGGSSTMAVKDNISGATDIVNSPAEGTARKVMTAVGVFDNNPYGAITSLKMTASSQTAVKNGQITLDITGYDDNQHKMAVPQNGLVLSSSDPTGTFSANTYTCGDASEATITASYNGATAQAGIKKAEVRSISPEKETIYASEGENVPIKVIGAATDGSVVDVTALSTFYTNFGTLNGNVFSSAAAGSGIVECAYGNTVCYVSVNVGTEMTPVDSFENIQYLDFAAYPNTISGIAGISQKYVSDKSKALGLSYNFAVLDSTQAAYLQFTSPVTINKKAKSLKLQIYGNGTGQWVRGIIKDAKNNQSVIDFSKNVNWNGWSDVEAVLPDDAQYPISLTCIYVAALSNSISDTQVMYFDNLRAQTYVTNDMTIPQAPASYDGFEGTVGSRKAGNYYVNMTGTVSSGAVADENLYGRARTAVNSLLEQDADMAIYGGASDVASTNAVKWQNDYSVYYKDKVTFVNMTAANGGFRTTKPEQWQKFKNDVMESQNKYVVFFMDTAPSNFKDQMEYQLFKSALADIKNAGREVFVVSASGETCWNGVEDGIRFINLPSLFKADGSINQDFRIMKLEFSDTSVTYELTKPSIK